MSRIHLFALLVLLSISGAPLTPAQARRSITLNVQTRNAATGEVTGTPTGINPAQTAIIIIDMWNFHWCMTATERVSAMVPRMNRVLAVARELGMQVVWNPSDVVTAYSGYPQYEKAVAVQHRPAPQIREALTAHFTAPYGQCMCGPGIYCRGNYGWDAMHPDLAIAEEDLISSSTDEIYTLLADRGITTVIYMGVHTNMCVFGKPGAMSSMWSAGFNCLLARDLNDAYTAYDPERGYTPDTGTTEIDENLLQAGVPNVNMGDDFRKAGLWKSDAPPVDYVRFAPWGTPARPYFMDQPTMVTLTAPWLDGAEIRYTTDGSEPTAQSTLYTAPFKIAETATLRAAAFRRGRPVSLPSLAHYVRMAQSPPLPDGYLDDLNYIPNAYLKSVSNCLWYPQKWKSFEGKPLRIRGATYAHGMGFRAPSSVQYDLKPEYRRFVALAGVDENMLEPENARAIGMHASVIFCVYIDGVKKAESPVMRLSQEPWRFDVAIPEGSRRINLSCMDAGSRHPLDYGNWVNAGFVIK